MRGPCLPVPRPAMGKRGGCPALWRVSRPLFILGFRWCFYVCCRLSCLSCWPGLVAGLPSWWCLWLVSFPVCPVSLAVLAGGGFCLSAGGGFCSRHLLACWFSCRSAGGCAVRVITALWVLSLPLIWAVPALIGGKSDRQREEKPPSGNQQNQRGAFLPAVTKQHQRQAQKTAPEVFGAGL
jgi:hypothetical protein